MGYFVNVWNMCSEVELSHGNQFIIKWVDFIDVV